MAATPDGRIAVKNIVDNADIRKLAGNITRKTLIAWRAKDFPAPIRTTGGGVELWDRTAVKDWLRARGT